MAIAIGASIAFIYCLLLLLNAAFDSFAPAVIRIKYLSFSYSLGVVTGSFFSLRLFDGLWRLVVLAVSIGRSSSSAENLLIC